MSYLVLKQPAQATLGCCSVFVCYGVLPKLHVLLITGPSVHTSAAVGPLAASLTTWLDDVHHPSIRGLNRRTFSVHLSYCPTALPSHACQGFLTTVHRSPHQIPSSPITARIPTLSFSPLPSASNYLIHSPVAAAGYHNLLNTQALPQRCIPDQLHPVWIDTEGASMLFCGCTPSSVNLA